MPNSLITIELHIIRVTTSKYIFRSLNLIFIDYRNGKQWPVQRNNYLALNDL